MCTATQKASRNGGLSPPALAAPDADACLTCEGEPIIIADADVSRRTRRASVSVTCGIFVNLGLPECEVPVQIFISYARDDDETPPGMSGTKGFVGFLYDQLNYEFRRLGEPKPRLWRDTRNIERAHQFEPILEK